MANVQSSINQMISLAGLLASQTPALQAKASKREQTKVLSKQSKVLAEREAALREAFAGPQVPGTYETGEQEYQDILQERAEVARKQYEIDPSKETYTAYAEAEKALKPERSVSEADPEEIAREQYEAEQKQAEVDWYLNQFRAADSSVANAQDRLRETRRRSREVVYGGME